MAITQADIDAIDRAIATGERSVRLGDKMVEYRSIDELVKAKSAMITEIAKGSTAGRSRSIRLYRCGNGWS